MKDIVNDRTALLGMAVFAFAELFNIAGAALSGNLLSGDPTPVLILTYLAVSVFEETVFRIAPARFFFRSLRSKKEETAFVIITSAAFGLFHLVNLLSGASLSYTVLQIIFASSIGAFFCVLYLRTGSAFMIVAMHVIHDVVTGLNTPGLEGGVIYVLPLTLRDIIVVVLQSLVFALFALVMSKR